jgi:PAS domain S-box-containing protein
MSDPQGIEKAVFEEVLRQMPAAIMIVEAPSGETILLNRQTQQMSEQYLGRSELSGVEGLRDLHDSGVFELFRPDGRPYEFEEWPVMRSITSGEEVRDEDVIQVMADGTQLTIRCNSSPIYNEEGRIVAGILVTQNITERMKSEGQLAYYTLLEENTHDGFIATDNLYVIRAWNRGAEEIYGWTAEEVVGRSVLEVARTDLSDEQLAEARRHLDETDRWRAEVVAYRKDGSPVWVELTNVAVRGEGGRSHRVRRDPPRRHRP